MRNSAQRRSEREQSEEINTMPVESEHRQRRGRKLTPRPRRGGGLEAEPLPAAAEVPEQLLGEVGAQIGHLGHLSAPAGEEEGLRLRCRPLLHCTMNLSCQLVS